MPETMYIPETKEYVEISDDRMTNMHRLLKQGRCKTLQEAYRQTEQGNLGRWLG